METYETRLEILVQKIQTLKDSVYSQKKPVIVTNGKRYSKILYAGSVYAFIDKTNGDVLKPASCNSPAKHTRGNIYKDDYGFGCCGAYSVAYLK